MCEKETPWKNKRKRKRKSLEERERVSRGEGRCEKRIRGREGLRKFTENGNGRRKASGEKESTETMTLKEKTRILGRWKDQTRRRKECDEGGTRF